MLTFRTFLSGKMRHIRLQFIHALPTSSVAAETSAVSMMLVVTVVLVLVVTMMGRRRIPAIRAKICYFPQSTQE